MSDASDDQTPAAYLVPIVATVLLLNRVHLVAVVAVAAKDPMAIGSAVRYEGSSVEANGTVTAKAPVGELMDEFLQRPLIVTDLPTFVYCPFTYSDGVIVPPAEVTTIVQVPSS